MIKKILICLSVISLVLISGTGIYLSNYYHADETALEALHSDGNVRISETDYGWLFDGPSDTDALILYPGAKVEESSYAPLARKLAEKGMDVCLVKMPARMAILDANKAEEVMKQYDYDHWYIGGHSLGGVSASSFASKHTAELDGVVLLASYSTSKLDDSLNVISVYGSDDTVLNLDAYEKNSSNLPEDTEEHIINGGNHAQFGSYGEQKGDGKAQIDSEDQIELTAEYILEDTRE